jgi:hypothetical protein
MCYVCCYVLVSTDLPQDAVALDHVLSVVREYDSTITDEQVCTVTLLYIYTFNGYTL